MISAEELAALDKRMADFTVMQMRAAFLREVPDPNVFGAHLVRMMTDAGDLRLEVTRLAAQRQAVRDLHVPMSASDGKAICTGCSVNGAEVPWPCATWKITDKT